MFEAKLSSRRQFVAESLKAVAGAGALAASASVIPAAAKANLRFGLATYELGKDWNISDIIKNLTIAKVHAVELKTLIKYANGTTALYPHGVELELDAKGRAEAKKRFADSPVELVSLATSEHIPWADPQQQSAAIEAAKGYLKLSHDVGSKFIRLLPNEWLPNVSHERTLDQIAECLNQCGGVADDLGQQIALEAHSAPGTLQNMRYVMDRVKYRCIGIRLNSEDRNAVNPGFEEQFQYVKNVLSPTMHIHNLKEGKYPYQLVINTLTQAGWDGWAFLEVGANFPDRVAMLAECREIWETMVAKAAAA
ncbi:MAG TPA: TIM barrel protein [Bryobacteraceae bacterium]|nr:TIM barrel protein [Bryobacteraceae bacterium]